MIKLMSEDEKFRGEVEKADLRMHDALARELERTADMNAGEPANPEQTQATQEAKATEEAEVAEVTVPARARPKLLALSQPWRNRNHTGGGPHSSIGPHPSSRAPASRPQPGATDGPSAHRQHASPLGHGMSGILGAQQP